MFQEEFQAVCNAGNGKLGLMKKNPLGYFVSSMMAGAFISFGSFITFVMGTPLKAADDPMAKFVMAFCFAAALSLVVMAGAELFTGNNFVMASASLAKVVSWGDTVKLWLFCYLGNLVGSWVAVGIFQLSGVPSGAVAECFASAAEGKMALTPMQMLTRGILCNVLVCLAVWCSIKLKNEVAKLIMVFWCIMVFMICSCEHSIANMSIMGVGLLNPGSAAVSVGGYVLNLVVVTIGNIIGGAVFVALPYYLISKKKKEA